MNFPFFKQTLTLSLILALLAPCSSKGSQVLILTENKRLEATICPDSMNRIAVANDRITQIFGDDGTFESQNDDNTGQVFLKPTLENGTKNLSLTLITEQGVTQDLTLKPTAKSAMTLIFKNTSPTSGASQEKRQEIGKGTQGPSSNPFGSNSLDAGFQPSFSVEPTPAPQHHLLVLLKQAVKGELPFQEVGFFGGSSISRPSPEGLQVSHHQPYSADPYDVHVFQVENTLQTTIEIQEKSFYQSGDLAISLQKRILLPGAKTLLYVVRLSETDVPETSVLKTRFLEGEELEDEEHD